MIEVVLMTARFTQPPGATAQAPDLAGYYALDTVIGGEAARLGLRVVRSDIGYTADVYPAFGPGPVKANEVIVRDKRVTVSTLVHEMPLRLELEFDGERVTGRWLTGADEGRISGKREKDPHRQ
jgi:hypothetical protein